MTNELVPAVCVLLFAAFFTAGCATTPPGPANISSDTVTMSLPFRYEGLGAGDNSVRDTVVLPVDTESVFISRAILEALQDLDYSIVSPEFDLGSPLPQGEEFVTDTVPLQQDVIADYNAENAGENVLPPRFYSLRYQGAYRLVGRDLEFKLSAVLFERAAATDPRPYTASYSGRYFVALLSNAIQRTLLKLSQPSVP